MGKKKGFDLTLDGGGALEADPSGIPDHEQKGNSLVDFSQSTSSLSSRRKKSNTLSIEWTTASSTEPITLPSPSPSGSMPNDGAAAAFTAMTVDGSNKGSSEREVSSCQSRTQEQVPSIVVGTAVSARGKLSEPV